MQPAHTVPPGTGQWRSLHNLPGRWQPSQRLGQGLNVAGKRVTQGGILGYRADATRAVAGVAALLVPAAGGEAVIELRMAPGDLTQLRFAYSPLSEAINSLHMLHSGQVHALHRRWAETARKQLRDLDTTLLQAIVPPQRTLLTPPFDLNGANTIERQLQLLADWPPSLLRAELETVWQGLPMPAAARQVIADGPAGARRVAMALGTYWNATIAPHWDQMRAVLDADIAYRAQQVTLGGISALLKDLHPQLQMRQSTIRINKTGHRNYDLDGNGLLLMPSVFAGSHLMFDPGSLGLPTIDYGPRGLGTVWDHNGNLPGAGDPLGALIGHGRTAILRSAELPRTTTDLARELGVSGATISVHLSILKRCGMVTSWRSGRRVLYQRTPLASSILSAVSQPDRRKIGGPSAARARR